MNQQKTKLLFIVAFYLSLNACNTGEGDRYSLENTPENGDLNNTFSKEDLNESSSSEQTIIQEKNKLLTEGWEERDIDNGQLPSCYNLSHKEGDVDNSLRVEVGSGTDVAIKLMNLHDDRCVRFVFINNGTSYKLKNIPEGKYYLKIAYGKNWLSKLENGQCIGKFFKNPLYEKGEDILDFNIIKTKDGYNIPSFELYLDIISSDISNSFNSQKISENEFNK